jgi:hypothetical protein
MPAWTMPLRVMFVGDCREAGAEAERRGVLLDAARESGPLDNLSTQSARHARYTYRIVSSHHHYPFSSAGLIGNLRKRTPVAACTALSTAGAKAQVPGSPMPPGASRLGTRSISITGAWLMRSIW